jgi:hypothetical protein
MRGNGDPNRVVSSNRRKHLIAYQVQADALRDAAIKKVTPNSFTHVGPKFLPRVSLREDIESQTLSAITAVRLLGNFED